MIKVAVILAAGLGSRLKDRTKEKPKGLLEVEGISLVERSVKSLLNSGIEKIFIGTGYLSEAYDLFAQKYPQIKTIKSDKYETTSSMYTLYNLKDSLNDDFLLLESDLLYEPISLNYLLEDKIGDIILSSGKTNSNDEVYIQVDDNLNLVAMSKKRDELDSIYSELVGISKISFNRYKHMCKLFENQDNVKIDYEYIMVETSKINPFFVKKIDDLIWCEIDDENHLNRALNIILPKIKEKYGKN